MIKKGKREDWKGVNCKKRKKSERKKIGLNKQRKVKVEDGKRSKGK